MVSQVSIHRWKEWENSEEWSQGNWKRSNRRRYGRSITNCSDVGSANSLWFGRWADSELLEDAHCYNHGLGSTREREMGRSKGWCHSLICGRSRGWKGYVVSRQTFSLILFSLMIESGLQSAIRQERRWNFVALDYCCLLRCSERFWACRVDSTWDQCWLITNNDFDVVDDRWWPREHSLSKRS